MPGQAAPVSIRGDVSGEILIVGDASRRRELVERVSGLGYAVDVCSPRELARVIRTELRPAAIIVAMEDTDPALLLAGLRRTRDGAAIPVVLYGRLGGAIRDLADVLDLGGDQFVEDPASSATLREVLLELAGAPSGGREGATRGHGSGREVRGAGQPRSVEPGWSMQTDRIRGRDDERDELAGRDLQAGRREGTGRFASPATAAPGRPETRDAGSNAAASRETTSRLTAARPPAPRPATSPDTNERSSDRGQGRGDTPAARDSRGSRSASPAPRDDVRPPRDVASGRSERSATSGRVVASSEGPDVDDDGATDERGTPFGGLHKTLERLEARLRVQEEHVESFANSEDDEREDLERLGLDEVPDVETEGDGFDPADSLSGLAVVDAASDVLTTGIHEPPGRRVDSTERIQTDTGTPTRTRFVDAPRARTATPTGRGEGSPVLRPKRPERQVASSDEAPSSGDGRRTRERGESRRVEAPATPWTSRGAGALGEVDVAMLLMRLHEEGLTGRISLSRDRTERQIWMVDGRITFARSNAASDRLVDSLARRGVLTRAQLDTARRLVERDPRRAGRVLVEAGLLKAGEIDRVLREHLVRIVVGALDWSDGSWRVDVGNTTDEPVVLDIGTEALLMTGVRESLDDAFMRARLAAALPRPAIDEQGRATLRERRGEGAFSRMELAFLEQVDGRRSFEACIRGSGLDEHDALAGLYLAWILGVVDSLGTSAPRGDRVDPLAIDKARIFERLAAVREGDYFAVLGVRRDASRGEIRRAWAELSTTFADEALEPETAEVLHEELDELRLALVEARDVLLDDTMRSAYLAHLDAPDPSRARS
jgi:hypothetical protein